MAAAATAATAAPTYPQPATNQAEATPGDLLKEYIAGGQYTADQLRVLLSGPRDLDASITAETYDLMMRDPKIWKCVRLLKIATIADGVELKPAVGEMDPQHEQAVEIRNFCDRLIEGLNRPLRETLEQMLDAIFRGNVAAEITWKYSEVGEDKGKLVLKSIKPKPRWAYGFVVDVFMNLIGFVGARPGMGMSSGVDPANMIPREKMALLTLAPRDEDPRGTVLIRAAHNWWNLKSQLPGEYLRWLLLCSLPLLVGIAAQRTTREPKTPESLEPQRDADGKIVTDPATNKPKLLTPIQALYKALVEARSGTALAVPFGTKIDWVEASGDGTAFTNAINACDRQIEESILHQTLAASEGLHQARAAASTHMQILDLVIAWLKGCVAATLREDVLKLAVRYNFGPEWERLAPKVSLGDTERRDFATDLNAVSDAYAKGFVEDSQKDTLYVDLGLPPRNPDPNAEPDGGVDVVEPEEEDRFERAPGRNG